MAEQVVVPNKEGEAVSNPYPNPTVVMDEEVVEASKRLILEGIEVYADVIVQYKSQMGELLKAGLVSQQTASQLLIESEQSFFKQLVQVKYS